MCALCTRSDRLTHGDFPSIPLSSPPAEQMTMQLLHFFEKSFVTFLWTRIPFYPTHLGIDHTKTEPRYFNKSTKQR